MLLVRCCSVAAMMVMQRVDNNNVTCNITSATYKLFACLLEFVCKHAHSPAHCRWHLLNQSDLTAEAIKCVYIVVVPLLTELAWQQNAHAKLKASLHNIYIYIWPSRLHLGCSFGAGHTTSSHPQQSSGRLRHPQRRYH